MEKLRKFYKETLPFAIILGIIVSINGDMKDESVFHFWIGFYIYLIIGFITAIVTNKRKRIKYKKYKTNNEDDEFDDVCCRDIAEAQAGILTLENMEYYGMFNMFNHK